MVYTEKLNCKLEFVWYTSARRGLAEKLVYPKIEDYGDYVTNIAMFLAKQLKMKPYDLVKKIAEKINEYIRKDTKIIISSHNKKYLKMKLKHKIS